MRVYKNHAAVYNGDQFRYEIALKEKESIDFNTALRTVAATAGLSWKQFAEFMNVPNASVAFRVVYGRWNPDTAALRETIQLCFTIDDSAHVAYLYRHDHQPSGTTRPDPVKPTITSNEVARTIKQYLPTQVLSRVEVGYDAPIAKALYMSVTPKKGYIFVPGKPAGGRANEPLYFHAKAKRLNEILEDIRFVSNTEGTGANVKVEVAMTADYANAVSTEVALTVEANPSASAFAPEVTMPSGASNVVMGEISEFEDITVAEAQDRPLLVTVVPFNCELHDIPGHVYPLTHGQAWTARGDAEYINRQLAGLKVRTLAADASVAVKAVSGNASDLKYYSFTPAEPPSTNPTITVGKRTVKGKQSTEIPLGVSFSGGTSGKSYAIAITPVKCTVRSLAAGNTISSKYDFNGTVDKINAEIKNAKIIVGSANGRVDITYPGGSETITVQKEEEVPPPPPPSSQAPGGDTAGAGELGGSSTHTPQSPAEAK